MYNDNEYIDYEFTGRTSNTGSSAEVFYPYAGESSYGGKKKSSGKKRAFRARTAALVLCCSMLGGAVGAAAAAAFGNSAASQTTVLQSSRAPVAVNVSYKDTSEKMTAAEVYASYVNSTVGITTSVTTNYFGFKTSSAASGSGFIISEDGYIITNYHVIEDSDSITVTLYDSSAFDAVLIGYDEENDVAVLKINAQGLSPVVLGDSDSLNVGDDVIAIGNPLGELTFSLTKGSVSALGREVTFSNGVTMELIQTDAAINSGNSGGALFNMYGEVVGITNAKYSGSSMSSASIDNIGFAIPLNTVREIINGIIEKGYVSKPYIDVSLANASSAALVYSVEENGPADKAGLAANDIITEANGEKITSSDELSALVSGLEPGDELELTVMRGGENTVITVTVGEKQQSALPEQSESSGRQQAESEYGFPFGYYGGFSRG